MTEENPSHTNYLTEEILEKLCHKLATTLFQDEEPMGFYADHDHNKLDASLKLPQQITFGVELYPTLYKKAAILFYAINRNHAFGNGNKRLSVASLIVFLYINDRMMSVSQHDMRDKALWLAQVTQPIDEVISELAIWIEQNSIAIQTT